jgi:hypothetical protein
MVILGVLGTSVIGAITARSAIQLVKYALDTAEEYPRKSTHNICGHTFICKTNKDFELLEEGYKVIKNLASSVVTDANLDEKDTAAMEKFILEGVLLWGTSGMDLRVVVLSKLQDESLVKDVAEAILNRVEHLLPHERQVLLALHTFAA